MKKSKVPVEIHRMRPQRLVIIDLLHLGLKVSRVHAYGEEDITNSLQRLESISEKLGRKISYTAYLATCWAAAINNNKMMQAYRRRNNIVIFEDIDIACIVEREFGDKKVPTSYIIRGAQKKNVIEISDEIREAQESKSETAATSTERHRQSRAAIITRLPGFIRRLILARMTKDPWLKKELFGTVGLSSIGMFTQGSGSAIPVTVHSSTFIVGGIMKKPWVVGNEIKIRDVITATISMDHDLVDGGPAARTVAELRNLARECHGLDKIEQELGIQ